MTPDYDAKARELCGCGACRQPEIGLDPLPCERADRIATALREADERATRRENEACADVVGRVSDIASTRMAYVLLGAMGIPAALNDAIAAIRARVEGK